MEKFTLKSIGKLNSHPDVPDEWLISKPIAIPFFNRKELTFTIDGDLENKNFLINVDEVIKRFLSRNESDKLKISNQIYNNYKITQNFYDSQSFGVLPLELKNENEIWKYVNPFEIYICKESEEDKNIYLLIHCSCEWEVEHGLQLVFKNGMELSRVSGIDYSPIE